MKKQEFIQNVYDRVNKNSMKFTKGDITQIYNEIFSEIANQLKNGETIEVSTLGKFEVKKRKARQGVNPMTGQKMEIPESNAVRFKASASLKRRINEE